MLVYFAVDKLGFSVTHWKPQKQTDWKRYQWLWYAVRRLVSRDGGDLAK